MGSGLTNVAIAAAKGSGEGALLTLEPAEGFLQLNCSDKCLKNLRVEEWIQFEGVKLLQGLAVASFSFQTQMGDFPKIRLAEVLQLLVHSDKVDAATIHLLKGELMGKMEQAGRFVSFASLIPRKEVIEPFELLQDHERPYHRKPLADVSFHNQ